MERKMRNIIGIATGVERIVANSEGGGQAVPVAGSRSDVLSHAPHGPLQRLTASAC
jgi:hypothetical protein